MVATTGGGRWPASEPNAVRRSAAIRDSGQHAAPQARGAVVDLTNSVLLDGRRWGPAAPPAANGVLPHSPGGPEGRAQRPTHAQLANEYEALAGRKSHAEQLLAVWLGAHLLGAMTLGLVVGFPILLGSAAAGVLALNEVLKLREEIVAKNGLQLRLHERGLQGACWGAGALFSVILVGIVPLIVQCWWFFSDHGALAEALETPTPAPIRAPQER